MQITDIKIDDFDYPLPDELIARHPLTQTGVDHAGVVAHHYRIGGEEAREVGKQTVLQRAVILSHE